VRPEWISAESSSATGCRSGMGGAAEEARGPGPRVQHRQQQEQHVGGQRDGGRWQQRAQVRPASAPQHHIDAGANSGHERRRRSQQIERFAEKGIPFLLISPPLPLLVGIRQRG
jgi:hypothetical protein